VTKSVGVRNRGREEGGLNCRVVQGMRKEDVQSKGKEKVAADRETGTGGKVQIRLSKRVKTVFRSMNRPCV